MKKILILLIISFLLAITPILISQDNIEETNLGDGIGENLRNQMKKFIDDGTIDGKDFSDIPKPFRRVLADKGFTDTKSDKKVRVKLSKDGSSSVIQLTDNFEAADFRFDEKGERILPLTGGSRVILDKNGELQPGSYLKVSTHCPNGACPLDGTDYLIGKTRIRIDIKSEEIDSANAGDMIISYTDEEEGIQKITVEVPSGVNLADVNFDSDLPTEERPEIRFKVRPHPSDKTTYLSIDGAKTELGEGQQTLKFENTDSGAKYYVLDPSADPNSEKSYIEIITENKGTDEEVKTTIAHAAPGKSLKISRKVRDQYSEEEEYYDVSTEVTATSKSATTSLILNPKKIPEIEFKGNGIFSVLSGDAEGVHEKLSFEKEGNTVRYLSAQGINDLEAIPLKLDLFGDIPDGETVKFYSGDRELERKKFVMLSKFEYNKDGKLTSRKFQFTHADLEKLYDKVAYQSLSPDELAKLEGKSIEEQLEYINRQLGNIQAPTSATETPTQTTSTLMALYPSGFPEGEFISKGNQESYSSNPIVAVKIGAKWCGPCQNMNNDFKDKDSNTPVMDIDGDHNPQFVSDNNVKGYPTTIFFKNGREVGRRTGRMTPDQVDAYASTLN